ncbi:MAG: cation:proton antiporter, partial [Nitrospinota bacterium]
EDILHFSEFGVVLLLFLIGLELNPARLWKLKKQIFGMGGLQLALSAFVISMLGVFLGFDVKSSIIAALGLSLSSTAIALQTIRERNLFNTAPGDSAFSILLFQDIAVIPMMVLLPIIGSENSVPTDDSVVFPLLKAIGVIAAIILGGRYLLRPVFRIIANTNTREIFTAFSLLLVIGIGLLMEGAGLSMALGTFIAGVILSGSEYRHELEIDIEPFKGLLLGLFFISVGMSVNFVLFLKAPGVIVSLMLALVFVKILVLFGIGKLFSIQRSENIVFSFLLSQGGEFAFVLFTIANATGTLSPEHSGILTVIVALSMATTPLLMLLYDKLFYASISRPDKNNESAIETLENPVIIAGFGRFGQVIGRLLHSNKIGTTILDHNPNNIEMVRKYGYKVFYGDASRIDLLRTAGAEKASLLILATDDRDAQIDTVKNVKISFPNLKILARAEDRLHAFELTSLGVTHFTQEAYHSALLLGEKALTQLGYGAYEAKKLSNRFHRYDLKTFQKHFPFHRDEVTHISLVKEARKELEEIFESDEKEFNKDKDTSWG